MVNDLNLLHVFYEVVTCGSISKAALKLYISQPATSQSIKALEEEIGFPLLIRSSKGVKLTNEGNEIFQICKKIASAGGGNKPKFVNRGVNRGVNRCKPCKPRKVF